MGLLRVPVADRLLAAVAKATTGLQATTANQPLAPRVNTTDPTSTLMPSKYGGYDQNHNIQALATGKQFIVAIGAHQSSNDKQALHGLVTAGRANLDAAGITDPIGAALFDSGYASAANFTTDLPVNLLLVAIHKEHKQTSRTSPTTTSGGDDTSTSSDTSNTSSSSSSSSSSGDHASDGDNSSGSGVPDGWQQMADRLTLSLRSIADMEGISSDPGLHLVTGSGRGKGVRLIRSGEMTVVGSRR
jgi:hypothetical protein